MLWERARYLGYHLLFLAYSMYHTTTRPLFGSDIYDPSFLVRLAGAEYSLVALSFLVGGVGDLLGRRRLLAVSSLGFIPLLMVFYAPGVRGLVLVSAALYSLSHYTAVITAISYALEDRSSVGRRFSMLGIASSLGWFFGSTIAWPLFMTIGNEAFAPFVSALYLVGIYLLGISHPRGKEAREKRSSDNILRPVAYATRSMGRVLLAVIFAGCLNIVGTSYCAVLLDARVQELTSALLDQKASRTLYGLFYGGIPTLLGVPARLLAAKVVDNGLHYEAFVGSVLSYLVLYTLLPFTPPLLFVILWQIPVYPFYDTSMFAIASRRTSSFESSVSGLMLTATSISGITVLCVTSLLGDISLGLYQLQIQAFATMAIVLMATAYPGRKRLGRSSTLPTTS